MIVWDIERQALGGVPTPCHNLHGHRLCTSDTLVDRDWLDMVAVLASLVLGTNFLPQCWKCCVKVIFPVTAGLGFWQRSGC